MQLGPFRIEQYYAEHEFTARYMLSSSDCESRTVGELLELEPGAEEQLRELWCGYTESPGDPALRAELAAGLEALQPEIDGLRGATEALRLLGRDGDLAWQCYAMSLLAEHLADEE